MKEIGFTEIMVILASGVAVCIFFALLLKVMDIIYRKYILMFKIVHSEGTYDVMLGDRRLVSQPTYKEAKQWLDEHKEDYRKKDKVLYVEKF